MKAQGSHETCNIKYEMNKRTVILKAIIALILLYAFIMTFVDNLFSALSMSSQTQMDIFISEKMVPGVISMLSMVYCLYCLFSKK